MLIHGHKPPTPLRGRLTRAMWLVLAILIPGGIVVLALLAMVRFAGSRVVKTSEKTPRAA